MTDDDALFSDDPVSPGAQAADPWVVLSVDDDPSVHGVFRLAFSDLVIDGRGIELLEASSAEEARSILARRDDISVAILDVVMEREEAGLELAEWIRARPDLARTRVVLRSGQPGRAPEAVVFQRYDINDYWPKTELTAGRSRALLTAQIRAYAAMLEADALRRASADVTRRLRDALAAPGDEGLRRHVAECLARLDAAGEPAAPRPPSLAPEVPRRVLVTGASRGFGALIARALAAAGHTVFAGVRDPDGRNAAAAASLRALGVTPVALDVTRDASVDACAAALDAAGGVDAVVQNAGVAAVGLVETFTPDRAASLFAVNVFGAMRVLRALLPQMRCAGGGTVVWISSTDGREVMPLLGVYDASKGALEALAEAWRYELNALGINSVIVQPGTFPTTSILDSLVAADAPERAAPYGELSGVPDHLVAGLRALAASGAAPDPALVAEAVRNALRGGAPPRVVVDPSGFDGAARINAACDAVQAELLGRFGLAHLARPRSPA